jgi:hypothetical protein
MTNPSEDLLVTTEGVDEGSAASTVEGEQSPAPPVDMETDESRAVKEARGDGQQLQAGEG